MLLALALPQSEMVDLMFAYDLANLIGHLAVSFPVVNVKLIAVKQAENGDLMEKDEIVQAALAEKADLVVFLGDERRFAPDLFDKMLLVAIPEYIEKQARIEASKMLTTGMVN